MASPWKQWQLEHCQKCMNCGMGHGRQVTYHCNIQGHRIGGNRKRDCQFVPRPIKEAEEHGGIKP